MSLPVPPDVETILSNGIATLRDVILPDTHDEWARFNAGLLIGALEYAIAQLGENRAGEHRADLRAALERLRGVVEQSGQQAPLAALQAESPFEAASSLLVWSQNNPGALANELRGILHPVLFAQMERESEAAEPIMGALQRGMRGEL